MHVKHVLRGNVQLIVTVCQPTAWMNFWKTSEFIEAKEVSFRPFVNSPSTQIDRFVERYIVILKGLTPGKL